MVITGKERVGGGEGRKQRVRRRRRSNKKELEGKEVFGLDERGE